MFKTRKREISLFIFQNRCIGCERCVEKCRHKVFGMLYTEDKSYATVEHPERCTGCGKCQQRCPTYAIEITSK